MGNDKENFFERAEEKIEDIVDDSTNTEATAEDIEAPLGGLPSHN